MSKQSGNSFADRENKYYRVLVAGSISIGGQGGNADLTFTIVGTNGSFSVSSKLIKLGGVWTLENLNLR